MVNVRGLTGRQNFVRVSVGGQASSAICSRDIRGLCALYGRVVRLST